MPGQTEGVSELELTLVGLPKTATTWLASVLDYNPEVNLFDESDKIERLWARPQGVPLLIAESVTDPLFLGAVERRAEAVRALQSRVPGKRHLLFLREPGDWVVSLYRQFVKRGGYRRFRDFFGETSDHIVTPAYLDYGWLVEDVGQAVPGPVAICHYDCLLRDPQGFVTAITRAFGGDTGLQDLVSGIPPRAFHQQANVGLRGRGARWLRALNRIRRSRWNPHGWFSWKRAERLPWSRLGMGGSDLLDDEDRAYLAEMVERYADWSLWEDRFKDRCVFLHG
ncbi:hypothetical protein [Thiohalorhabdus sp.]|uniref:hypothetical protein n=1 Tax=Thiohalorhabdus sp. TaxID=3094134 RepID=UPI002FC3D643